MDDIFVVSDRAVDRFAELDPLLATELGIAGHDHRWPDLSPDGHHHRRDAAASVRDEVLACPGPDRDTALARRVLADDAGDIIDEVDSGDHLHDLNNIVSPHQMIRQTFDHMATDSREAWEAIATRLETIHEPVAGYRATLEEGARQGITAARRQVEAVVAQGDIASGDRSSFLELIATAHAAAGPVGVDADLAGRLDRAARHACAVFGELNDFLRTTYLPVAREHDAVGAETYARRSRRWLGTRIDAIASHEWGWSEVERLWDELKRVSREVVPEATTAEVIELLRTDPARAAGSREEFIELMQQRQDRARSAVIGTHFELPPDLQPIEVKVEPAGGASAPHYVPPSEDRSRAGCVWYPVAGRSFFPLFAEITTAHHEGYPGHHLQCAVQAAQGDRLSRYQRIVSWNPGSGEGWALYAEQLMDELGQLDEPDYRVGLLSSQLLRACRVAVDIGIHHGLSIPTDATFHPGERWTAELAEELLVTRALLPADHARDEVVRYCGWPAQAISYKVGEQTILDLRDEARARGDSDLRTFHARVLGAGAVGLDILRDEVRAQG
ncbi:MAG: DUF885 domain-containing protein [Acidimicrobiales bacterium]